MATMNISLPEKMKEWVEFQVESDKFSNASEYLRDLIRRDKERQTAIAEIRAELAKGEASGYIPFDTEEMKKELRLAARKNAA